MNFGETPDPSMGSILIIIVIMLNYVSIIIMYLDEIMTSREFVYKTVRTTNEHLITRRYASSL